MDREIQILINKGKMGDLTAEEKKRLQNALLGTAPASPEFQQIATALKAPNPMGFVEPQNVPQDDGITPSFAAPGMMTPLFGMGTNIIGDLFGSVSANEAKPSPAERSDEQGSFPIGTGTRMPETSAGQSKFDPYGRNADPELGGKFGITTSSGLSSSLGGNPEDIFSSLGPPQGYTFSDMNSAGLEQNVSDPAAYARTFAREAGGGDAFAEHYVDPVKAAMAMAATGIIGPGGQAVGNNLQGGAGMSNDMRLQAIEEFMRDYASREKEVDPAAVYREMFERASNTDFSLVDSPQTQLPVTHEEIIQITNESLMAAAPFMTEDGVAWMSAILENMKNQYLDYLGSKDPAEETLSYPAFLAANDIDKLLGQ